MRNSPDIKLFGLFFCNGKGGELLELDEIINYLMRIKELKKAIDKIAEQKTELRGRLLASPSFDENHNPNKGTTSKQEQYFIKYQELEERVQELSVEYLERKHKAINLIQENITEPLQLECVYYNYVELMPTKDIAKELDVTRQTVHRCKRDGIVAIYNSLKEHPEEALKN